MQNGQKPISPFKQGGFTRGHTGRALPFFDELSCDFLTEYKTMLQPVTACKYWNNLPINLRSSASTNVFKRSLYKHFRSFQSIHNQFPTFLNCNF